MHPMANEKRLIDAEALQEKLIYDTTKTSIGGGEYIVDWRICDAIENAPTVDAVTVVRCRECKSWRAPWLVGQELGRCMLGKTALTEPCHFCSYGRKIEEVW